MILETSKKAKPALNIHLVGIAGEGMVGLAQCLIDLKHTVTGSDLKSIEQLAFLQDLGVKVFSGHQAENIHGVDLLIRSDAIPISNIELTEAKTLNIPVISRAQSIEELLSADTSLWVAGSHGKSTTSAMIATALKAKGLDPSFLIGAAVPSLDLARGHIGRSEFFVGEACEAFQNLIHFEPSIAIITNIDDEHIEHYGSQVRLDKAFLHFANRASTGVIINNDDPGIQRIARQIQNTVITFGIHNPSDVQARNIQFSDAGTQFDLYINNELIRAISIPLPGEHIVLNALATVAALKMARLSLVDIDVLLGQYRGANRRWQEYKAGSDIRIIDDYAHHPTEIRAIRTAARAVMNIHERLVIVFQPQLFSRTKRLAPEFAYELSQFDQVLLLEVDGGGEADEKLVSCDIIAQGLYRLGSNPILFSNSEDLIENTSRFIRKNDFVLVAGAAGISKVAKNMAGHFCNAGALSNPQTTQLVKRTKQQLPQVDFISPVTDSYPGVLRLFYEQVVKHPQGIAVSNSQQVITYYQLNRAANRIANFLVGHHINKGDVLAVQATPSLEFIALIISLQKLGAIYLPLDLRLPQKRSSYQAEIANAKMWISSPSKLEIEPNHSISHLSISAIRDQFNLSLQEASHAEEVNTNIDENDIAYICFTSGSTGVPKGVAIKHAALKNFAAYTSKYFQINSSSKVIVNTSIAFDVSVGEIWTTLAGGGQLSITESKTPLVGSSLSQFLEANEITHLCATPSVIGSLQNREFPSLRCIISAGEALSQSLVNVWAQSRQFFNAYGPTEATIYASIDRCRPEKPVRLGKALDNVFLRVISEDCLAIEAEGVGELCIGGAGLMKHYLLSSPDTDFITLTLGNAQTETLYRTGDVVKRHDDGSLEYLHRIDSQIKINGLRIELEEIEQTLLREDFIVDVAAILDKSESQPVLIAFVLLNGTLEIDWRQYKEKLSQWLAPPMIPNKFIPVKSIPLTLAGKKDRNLILSDYKRKKILKRTYCAPRNSFEEQLARIWKKILNSEFDVGVTEDFQWLGGDSIQFLELIDQVELAFHIHIPPGFFAHSITIEQLAIKVAELLWARDTQARDATAFPNGRVYKGLRDLTAHWQGVRASKLATIISCGPASAKYDLFICLQNDYEFNQISLALGDEFRVHAMRSGHLLMDYTPAATLDLAKHYVDQIEEIGPTGKVIIGGICQGGSVAAGIAKLLRDKNRAVELLLLIDQSRLISYPGKLAFIYSGKGPLNPYKRFNDDLSRYDGLYEKNYSIDMVDCDHGMIHTPPHIGRLARIIYSLLPQQANPTDKPGIATLGSNGRQTLNKHHHPAPEKSFVNANYYWHFEKSSLTDGELIASSPFFDARFYLENLGDSSITEKNALDHFTNFGWKLDLNPSLLFNTLDYQKRYPEVLSENCNPLVHYLRKGMYQGRTPWPSSNLLQWQGTMHLQPQTAVDLLANCPLPWLNLNRSQKVYLFAHSQGHFCFHQFQEMLSQAFTELGIENELADENSIIDPSASAIYFIIGPHEFFYLKGAKDPMDFSFERLIILNSEQLNSQWFATLMPILEKVQFVLDINLQSAASLVKLGVNARFLPLGYVAENMLFQAISPDQGEFKYKLDVATPSDDPNAKYFFVKRNIGLLWIGSNSQRRHEFWQENKNLFESINAIVRLVSYKGLFNKTHPNAIDPKTFLQLSHHSKILLNIHRFEAPYFEWQRLIHYGFMQGCCVVTETSSRLPGLTPGVHYFEDEIQNLPTLINWLINDPQGQQKLETVRNAGYQVVMTQFQLSRSLTELFKIAPMPSTQHEHAQQL